MRVTFAVLAGLAAFALAPAPSAEAAGGSAGCGVQQRAIVGGKDRQPTPGELRDLAAQAGCPTPSVDTSPGDAKEVDELYQELMDQTDRDLPAAPGKPQP